LVLKEDSMLVAIATGTVMFIAGLIAGSSIDKGDEVSEASRRYWVLKEWNKEWWG
jgi:hypothetical protein